MKIGIMTLSETECNYGAVLQHYALQEYLRRKGHDPFLIRYKGTVKGINFRNITPAKVFRFIKRKWSENLVHVQDQPRYFTDFKQMYLVQSELEYINYNDLKNNPPEADMYIVGSDQVWNFYNTPLKYCRNHIHAYFLDFGKEQTEKISYAASWDKRYVTNEQLKEIKPLINKFSYVSVREKSGLELCWKCGIMDAEWIPDPTLLLSSDDYRNIYQDKRNSIRKIKEKFLLIYLVLSKYKSFDLAFIYKYAVDKGLKVIYVTEDKINDSYEKYYPTIPEWLYLVAQAEYVVTNSFHGTVFSLIFHKQFGTIPLVGYSSATNKRIESLYELFHIEDRFIYDEDLSILDKNYKTDFCYPENRFENLLKFSGGGIDKRS